MWAVSVLGALSRAPGRRALSALAQLRGILEEELDGIRGAGTWKSERVITSRQGPRIRVDGFSGGNSPSRESLDLAAVERAVPRRALNGRPALGATGPCSSHQTYSTQCLIWLNPFPRREVICP